MLTRYFVITLIDKKLFMFDIQVLNPLRNLPRGVKYNV